MILGYLGGPSVICRALIKESRRQESQRRKSDKGSRNQSKGIAGNGHESRLEGNFYKLEKVRKQIFP